MPQGPKLSFAVLFAASAFTFTYFGPLGNAVSYLHFSMLTKEKLVREAKIYIRERAGGHQMACLYFVSCDGGRARLELVSALDAWNFRTVKKEIWRRRFSNYCPGRTTNFGLHLIPQEGHEVPIFAVANARWSFFNDRFIPRLGRFQSGSFSDQPWERCTPEKAIAN